jgi:hypothetical protein
MQSKDAILYVLQTARYVTSTYLTDLSDDELLVRPVPHSHHIAWQLGHLLLSEAMMASGVRAGAGIALPAGFLERHSAGHEYAESCATPFLSKAQYLALRTQQREKTIELVQSIAEAELSEPGPEKMRSYAPTKGAVLLAIGTHEMMHAGQWAVVRRLLEKPVVV